MYQPELKMGEFEQYRGVYCSLCNQLGKRYGFFARMTLSYDFTFLALFRMALDDGCVGFENGRCAFNPLKKRTCCCENAHVDFAADAATLLMYHKLKDNMADNGFFPSLPARLLLPFASRAKKKAANAYPELAAHIQTCRDRQAELETSKTASRDAAAEPSAMMLADLARMGAADEREEMCIRDRRISPSIPSTSAGNAVAWIWRTTAAGRWKKCSSTGQARSGFCRAGRTIPCGRCLSLIHI